MVEQTQSPLFARPNLKLFLLGAVLIVLVNDVFTGAQIQASARSIPVVGKSGLVTQDELHRLIQHAIQYPSVEAYARVSACYQKRGDYRRAMVYLMRAEHIDPSLDPGD